MKLAIMQPYLLPHLGYFSLIEYADEWIFFDDVQYIRRGWVNRNRILRPDDGWQYFTVPVTKHPREARIKDVRVSDASDWRRRILGQLAHYRNTAPCYAEVIAFLAEAFEHPVESIADLDILLVRKTLEYLDVPFRYRIFSDLDLELGPVRGPGDWALEISRALGASEYVNPPGGRAIFDPERFRAAGIDLRFLTGIPVEYDQGRKEFIPGLSILDVMMFNPRQTIREMLGSFEVSV